MNLNQLANAMKPAFLPGEELRVKVIQQGKEPGQGVAFLDDGTMIVVEGGGSYLQRELDVHRHPRAPDGRRPHGLRAARPPARLTRRPSATGRTAARRAPRQGTIADVPTGAFADAVIVAAGSSRRMGGRTSSQATSRAARCCAGRSRPMRGAPSVAATSSS